MSFALSLRPVTLSALPTREEVLEVARALIDSTPSWSAGKKFGAVQCFSRKAETKGPSWHGRRSVHPPQELTFDKIWDVLGRDHFVNEQQYIAPLRRAEFMKKVDQGEIWALLYQFTPPIANRVFTEFQLTYTETISENRRVGLVVTLPFDPEGAEEILEAKGSPVHGMYVSVERVTELEDGGVEWIMTTCSTPGGSIPQFVTERALPGQIAHDVPSLISWIKKKNAA